MTANKQPDPTDLQEILKKLNGLKAEDRIELCQKALDLVSKEQQPQLWSMLKTDLGISLAETSTLENLERAIEHLNEAFSVITSKSQPAQWANIQYNLGVVFTERRVGDRNANLVQAMEHFQNVLKVYKREEFPEQWDQTQLYVGNIRNTLAGDSTTDAPLPPPKKK